MEQSKEYGCDSLPVYTFKSLVSQNPTVLLPSRVHSILIEFKNNDSKTFPWLMRHCRWIGELPLNFASARRVPANAPLTGSSICSRAKRHVGWRWKLLIPALSLSLSLSFCSTSGIAAEVNISRARRFRASRKWKGQGRGFLGKKKKKNRRGRRRGCLGERVVGLREVMRPLPVGTTGTTRGVI